MGGGDFGRLRHEDGDAVAARDAVRGEHIGEPVGSLAQLPEADFVEATILPHMQDGEPAWIGGRPAVADIGADIDARRHLPAEGTGNVVEIVEIGQHRHAAANLVSTR